MVVHLERFTMVCEEVSTRIWAAGALTEGEHRRQRLGVRDKREPWYQTVCRLTAFIRVAEMVVRGNPNGFVVTTVGSIMEYLKYNLRSTS